MSRHQVLHWARTVSAGITQGFSGSGLCLAIQAQMPAQVPASMLVPAGGIPSTAGMAITPSGVHA